MSEPRRRVVLAAAVMVALLAACGDGDPGGVAVADHDHDDYGARGRRFADT